jgi:hypothetical protein
MAVTHAPYCCYVVEKAGFKGIHSQIFYIVGASATNEILDEFVTSLSRRCHLSLSPFLQQTI